MRTHRSRGRTDSESGGEGACRRPGPAEHPGGKGSTAGGERRPAGRGLETDNTERREGLHPDASRGPDDLEAGPAP